MRIGRTKAWLLGLAGLLALPAPAAELSFRERLDACIEAITENLGLPKGFVFQRQAPEAKDAIRLGLNIPFYSAPPVTGPLGFVRAVGIGIPEPTDYNELKDWVHTFGTVDQQKNFLKISSDLFRHFNGQGYSQEQSWALVQKTISNRMHVYLPLVKRNALSLPAIRAHKRRENGMGLTATDYYNLGLVCQKVGNHKEAAEMFDKAAKQNHAMAQASLGFLFETGQGVPRDLDKAMDLYHKAAKQGHSVAQFNLGRIYQNGLTHGIQQVKQDPKLAEQFLKRAAAQGIVAAHHQLGLFYLTAGNTIQHQLNQATPAQVAHWRSNNVAVAAWDKNADNRITSDENQQYQVAQVSFVNAAKDNHGPAQHALGVMYLQGMGVPANAAGAAQWLQKAADQQVPDALYNLAQLYEHGHGVRQNLTHAFTLYDQAANLGQPATQAGQPAIIGHPPSQYNLGLFYYQGRDAGTRLSVEVPRAFVQAHAADKLPGELVQLNPEKNAFLRDAVAVYRPVYGSDNFTLKLLVPKDQGENGKGVLEEFLAEHGAKPAAEPVIEKLGGYHPEKAYTWWKLAADQKQAAAITGLELLRRVLPPDKIREAEAEAARLAAEIEARKLLPPSPMVQAKAQVPFRASDWSTGFFVSEDGYVIAGKHLLHSGDRFQVVTENGVFPARRIPLPGDLGQYLLLKIDGDYTFQPLSIAASHGTRQRDPAQVLGYQLPHANQQLLPRAAASKTAIASVLGAQADPRFFTLKHSVLGDRMLLKFSKYLDDDQTGIDVSLDNVDLRTAHAITRERLRGVLRATHLLLSNTHISIGYQLTRKLWYDEVQREWLTAPTRARAHLYAADEWIEIDGRKVHAAPPMDAVREGQPLLRLSIIPGMVQRDAKNIPLDVQAALRALPEKRTKEQWAKINDFILRLYQLAEEVLKQDSVVPRKQTAMEMAIENSKYEALTKTPGFRGAALLNRHGQAIGVFYPTYRGRSPDVFRNFSSYHRYVLKSDHLKAFLDRLPDVKHTGARPALPRGASGDAISIDPDAYWLAKAKASMVLVQVTGQAPSNPTSVAENGGLPR